MPTGLLTVSSGCAHGLQQKAHAVTPTSATSSTGTNAGCCSVVPSETEGPFPTKVPAPYVRTDIRDGKAGYLLTATLTNSNSGCAGLAGVLVNIWHCDADGPVSESYRDAFDRHFRHWK